MTLIVCAPYFVKEHFSVKTLLFFVHLRLQQKRTEKVIPSYQIFSEYMLSRVVGLRLLLCLYLCYLCYCIIINNNNNNNNNNCVVVGKEPG